MPDTTNLIIFVLAGLTLNITPGPDMLYVATRSINQGRAAGVISALGIGGGSIVHMLAAALGLSAVIMYSSLAFSIIKYAGAAYLVYLGIRIIRRGGSVNALPTLPRTDMKRVFLQGALTNILNPKVAIFYFSFIPQFVNPETSNVALQIILMGTIFNITGTTVNTAVGLLMGSAGAWLSRHPLVLCAQRWFSGSVLIALGTRLAVSEQQ